MSKSQLAWQYSPEVKQNTALNRLARWINGDPELTAALRAAHYTPQQRILTARQVAIIYDFLGTPEEFNT